MLAPLLFALLAGPPASTAPPVDPTPAVRPEHREQLPVVPEAELDIDKAKRLFAAGKQAAQGGRWDEAVAYFAEAYRHSGSPGQLYSMGRGHRELYFHSGRDPVQLRLAILRFGQYLKRSPAGPNRANAQRYIEELQSYADVLEGFDEPPVLTRLMVYGPQSDTLVSIDDASPRPAPLTVDIEPGPHRVRMNAAGFVPQERVVDVPEGATVPIEIDLEPQRASLIVDGPAGASVWVDGIERGTLPRPAVTLDAGPHQIAVARSGHVPFVRELEFGRGEARTVPVTLATTAQRKASIALMAVGGAGVLSSAIVGGLALRSQATAVRLESRRETEGVTAEGYEQEQQAWVARDRRRTGAVVVGAVGLAALGTGVALYLADAPRLSDRLYPPERAAPEPSASPVVRLAPSVSPRHLGATLAGRF